MNSMHFSGISKDFSNPLVVFSPKGLLKKANELPTDGKTKIVSKLLDLYQEHHNAIVYNLPKVGAIEMSTPRKVTSGILSVHQLTPFIRAFIPDWQPVPIPYSIEEVTDDVAQRALWYAVKNNNSTDCSKLVSNCGYTHARIIGKSNCKLETKQYTLSINEVNGENDTPLTYASRAGFKAIVKLLINAQGINVDHRDKVNFSALDHAVMNKDREIIQLLIPKVSQATYNTAKSVAEQDPHSNILTYFSK